MRHRHSWKLFNQSPIGPYPATEAKRLEKCQYCQAERSSKAYWAENLQTWIWYNIGKAMLEGEYAPWCQQ